MTWKIIADSGCDYRTYESAAPDTSFVSVPLTIQIGETIYTDDDNLDTDKIDGRYGMQRLLLPNQLVPVLMTI